MPGKRQRNLTGPGWQKPKPLKINNQLNTQRFISLSTQRSAFHCYFPIAYFYALLLDVNTIAVEFRMANAVVAGLL